VFAKPIDEPITGRRDLNKSERRDGKFIVMGAARSVAFPPAEEVFSFMMPPVETSVTGHEQAARTLCGDTDPHTQSAPARPKRIGIKAFVGDNSTVAQAGQERLGSA
jgi:hypothetical protein